MATTHPYISGAGNVAQMVGQLRKAFPNTINSDTVKKLGLAPNNESYVINVLQYVGVIDLEGKKTPEAAKAFSHHKDEEFAKEFGSLVKKAYTSLFDLHGDGSWQLNNDELITFFRQSDQTSAAIGARQASTFRILAGLSGHGELPDAKPKRNGKGIAPAKIQKAAQAQTPKKTAVASAAASPAAAAAPATPNPAAGQIAEKSPLGLTVRVEINLPADGTKEAYDNIFKSIKENLLGG